MLAAKLQGALGMKRASGPFRQSGGIVQNKKVRELMCAEVGDFLFIPVERWSL